MSHARSFRTAGEIASPKGPKIFLFLLPRSTRSSSIILAGIFLLHVFPCFSTWSLPKNLSKILISEAICRTNNPLSRVSSYLSLFLFYNKLEARIDPIIEYLNICYFKRARISQSLDPKSHICSSFFFLILLDTGDC